MGVRREGSGKGRATPSNQHTTPDYGAAASAGQDVDDDINSDSELQEIYVQAYACQFFKDNDAAQAVEDGAHLRPLAIPQELEGQPLMLDRFDARWMLDMVDFNKGSSTLSRASSLNAEEQDVDKLRYLGLPAGDHSVEVEGLGRFAPQGSYAHENRRGLGDDEDAEEEQEEVYGYYGRTASSPPSASTRGSYAAVPNPGNSGHESSSLSQSANGQAGVDADGMEGSSGDGGAVEGDEEVFVPDFGVPEGVVVPPSARQHIMMVGTARTTVRSPQLEVLLRLKQASNAAFSFLSDEDPLHPYYVFLKSWGENALAAEYSRQQQLQIDRAEAKREEEERKKLEDERAASAQALHRAGSEVASDSELDGALNLLGGAYDSSDDDDDDESQQPASTAVAPTSCATSTSAGVSNPQGGGTAVASFPGEVEVAHAVEPEEAQRLVIEKMVGFVARNGQAFEERVKQRENNNSTFDFLLPGSEFHRFYKARLAEAKGESLATPKAVLTSVAALQKSGPTHGEAAASVAHVSKSHDSKESAANDSARTLASTVSYGTTHEVGEAEERASQRATKEEREISRNRPEELSSGKSRSNVHDTTAGTYGTIKQTPDGDVSHLPAYTKQREATVTSEAIAAKIENAADFRARNGAAGVLDVNIAGSNESGTPYADVRELQTQMTLAAARGAGEKDGSGTDSLTAGTAAPVSQVMPEQRPSEPFRVIETTGINPGTAKSAGITAAAHDDLPSTDEAVIGGESEETRRANRLKRARLMKGHYRLAVLKSNGQEEGSEGNQHSTMTPMTADNSSIVDVRASPDKTSASPQLNDDDFSASGSFSDLDSDYDSENVDGDASVVGAGDDTETNAGNADEDLEARGRPHTASTSTRGRRGSDVGDARSMAGEDDRARRKRGRSRSRSRSRSPNRRRHDARDRVRDRNDKSSRSRSRSKNRSQTKRDEGRERRRTRGGGGKLMDDRGNREKPKESSSGTSRGREEKHTTSSGGSDSKRRGDDGRPKDGSRSGSSGNRRREDERDDSRGNGNSRGVDSRRDKDGDRKARSRDTKGEGRSSSRRSRDRESSRRDESRERTSGSSSKRSRRR